MRTHTYRHKKRELENKIIHGFFAIDLEHVLWLYGYKPKIATATSQENTSARVSFWIKL